MNGLQFHIPRVKVRDCMQCGQDVFMPPNVWKALQERREPAPALCGECSFQMAENGYQNILNADREKVIMSDRDKILQVSQNGPAMNAGACDAMIKTIFRECRMFVDQSHVGEFVGLALKVSEKRARAVYNYLMKHPNKNLQLREFAELLGVGL